MYTEEVNKIALSSNDDKRIQAYDKITAYRYGTNTSMVCENEMRYVILEKIMLKLSTRVKEKSKNKSQILRSKSQILRSKSQALRNESQKLRTESQKLRTESQILRSESQALRSESYVLRNEIQIYRSDSQAFRNVPPILRSKSQILRSDHYTEEVNKIAPSSNDDNVDALDKINNKIDTINEINKRLTKIEIKAAEKVDLIYGAVHELQDEIYSDDSWLRLVELSKTDAIIDEALNVVWNEICGKNRISPEKININKDKDIDGYVSKLTDVINNKIE